MANPQSSTVKAIDIVVNLPDPNRVRHRQSILYDRPGFGGRELNLTPERFLEKMDAAGIERSFIVAAKSGSKYTGDMDSVPYEEVAEIVNKYPDRFSGLAGIDPWEGMEGVKALESAVKEMGFIGAHMYPHWFRMEPDHRKYYPFYAKCVELDIPIQMQVGHCLIYIADRPPLQSVGRPITLDTIACDLPDLKLIGIHTGYPWVEEMISVANKHPNVYIGCDAYTPKYWKPEFVHFINSYGQNKVLFGSDYAVVDNERMIREIEDLDFKPVAKSKLLRENAMRVYKL